MTPTRRLLYSLVPGDNLAAPFPNDIGLKRRQLVEKQPPNIFTMGEDCRIGQMPAFRGEADAQPAPASDFNRRNKSALFHPGQLMGEATFFPAQRLHKVLNFHRG